VTSATDRTTGAVTVKAAETVMGDWDWLDWAAIASAIILAALVLGIIWKVA